MVINLPDSERISADGLYFIQTVIPIQPGNSTRIVSRYHLDKEWEEVTSLSALGTNNPHFSQRTTGVIVRDYL